MFSQLAMFTVKGTAALKDGYFEIPILRKTKPGECH